MSTAVDTTAAEGIISMRLMPKTREKYGRAVAHFVDYLRDHHGSSASYDADTHDVNLISLTCDELKAYFSSIMRRRNEDGSEGAYYAFQHVSGNKSALVDLYKQRRITIPDDIRLLMNEFFGGLKRKHAELRQDGEVPTTEGKAAMTFPGYKFVANKAVTANDGQADAVPYLFAWVFLVFAWNLMARSVSVAGIMFDHIGWANDCLTVVFPKHKGDQVGNNAAPKHVYANPSNPTICPILALAVMVFSNGMRREGTSRLLFGNMEKAESKFSKWLRALCAGIGDTLTTMGLVIVDIGSHSFRKGIATFLSGIPGGPTAIAIYLRAGWSLGPVTSRYIMEGGGGDELCGRAATGKSLHSASFADLPPHFDLSKGTVLTDEEWEAILPGYATWYPLTFRPVLPFLLASLIYHRQWLESTLSKDHPLRSQRVWTNGIMARKAGEVFTGCMQNRTTGLNATGVPPHLVLANEMVTMRGDIASLEERLSSRLDILPTTLTSEILEHCQVQGALPITEAGLSAMLQSVRTEILEAFDARSAHMAASSSSQNRNLASADSTIELDGIRYKLWSWDGRLHNVPQGWNFPVVPASALWDLWLDGDKDQSIQPYRYLKSFDVKRKVQSQRLSRAKTVINHVIGMTHKDVVAIRALNMKDRDKLFADTFHELSHELFPSKPDAYFQDPKTQALTFLTIYDLLKRAEKRRR